MTRLKTIPIKVMPAIARVAAAMRRTSVVALSTTATTTTVAW